MSESKFAVFSEDAIVYIGEDPTEAAEAFKSKGGVKLIAFANTTELYEKFETHKSNVSAQCIGEDVETQMSEALNKFLDELDKLGINVENAEAFAKKARERGEAIAKKARNVSGQVLETVGSSIVWLGNILKQEEVAAQSCEEEKESCCHENNGEDNQD